MNSRRAGLGLAAAGLAGLGYWAGGQVERWVNRVRPVPLPQVSATTRALHQQAVVVDLHADSLLFERDLLQRSPFGHVDLPRLKAGNVAIQVLAAATRVPWGFNVERTVDRRPDLLTLAAIARRSGMAWQSPYGRALSMARQLVDLAHRSQGQLRLIRSRPDLDRFLADRARQPYLVGAILAVEGAQALEGDLGRLDGLYAAGYRILGLTHFIDTPFAASAHGIRGDGLTPLGRRLVQRLADLEMVLDLAHLAPAGIDDALALTHRPPLVSHGGVQATCPNPRNLSDRHIKAVAARGGLLGIGYWDTAVGGRHPRHIVAAMAHVIRLVGDAHVGLGSDFDGGILAGFDASQLAALTQQMVDAGFAAETTRRILGENALRVLRAALPQA